MAAGARVFWCIRKEGTVLLHDFLHLKAPGHWINDPNGFIYYKGLYHLFYQHFPYLPRWGTMHWGHAVSDDLVHWEHRGIALYPSKAYDRNGVFSGSAVEVDGALYLYYTAIRYDEENPDNIHRALDNRFKASQALVISPDGVTFDNLDAKRQVLPVPAAPEAGDPQNTRDPKVWRAADGSFRMVLGSTREGVGQLLFYRSADGLTWTCAGRFGDPALGTTLECPDLFCLDGRWVLLGSPMGITADGLQYPDQSTWMPVDFDETTCRLALQGAPAMVDWGLDLYAPQTTLDEAGHRVLIGWMRMPRPVEDAPDGRAPWRGMMSLPRLVEWREGQLCFPVHPHVTACFTQPAEGLAPLAEHKPVRLQGTLRSGQTWNVGGYRLWMEDGCLCSDRSAVFDGLPGYRLTARTPALGQDTCDLDIFVTDHLVEIFLDSGRYVLSHVVFGLDGTLEGDFNTVTTVRA